MRKYQCPNCKEYTIDVLQKASLNIRSNSRCKNCGKKFGLPYIYSALLIIIVCIAFYFTYISNMNLIIKGTVIFLILLLYYIVNITVMPIVRK
ncbi:hypothetical protein Q428_14875 [Fervidicella metallireducens AeB]|uniref:Cxxc_20_cxxc protein n=1 Tax=Fervidicella metallireducens AeB TaxID=1403537 RepID=A0A017RTF0_9CLOT|nr:hypothetical protein [Fervidicella metallireducens]EYE87165.1 hypothetical protein Q428_14875 [Fervidicella metallireducens AeB]